MTTEPDSRPSRRTENPVPSGAGRFRFSFTGAPPTSSGPPLLQRWQALGLLLLVTVGAASIPGVRGEPPAAAILLAAAAQVDGKARLMGLAPPLLAALFAWRASGRLARPFPGFTSFFFLATLSSLAVYIAFQLGLVLALRTAPAPLAGGRSLWQVTLPGAALGWVVLQTVAAVQVLRRRASAGLQSAREVLDAVRDRKSR
jgi:hypothetical protein